MSFFYIVMDATDLAAWDFNPFEKFILEINRIWEIFRKQPGTFQVEIWLPLFLEMKADHERQNCNLAEN